ncbi:MAG: hypothetical protein ACOX1J_01180 [Dethiobacteria bacterium]|jgi:hypothetical protein
MNGAQIKKIIEKSLKKLVKQDGDLIHRKVKEECINHKLACYIEQFLNEELDSHLNYEVDVEYNKNYYNPKKIIDENNNLKSIRPDIIVHKRNTNKHNLIAFEIKKDYSGRRDLEKIMGLQRSPYNYDYGCLISYLPSKKYIKVKLLTKDNDKIEFKLQK